MKTGKSYFYLDNIIKKERKESGLLEEFFTVIEVNIFNGNLDNADRKARTIALKLKKKLAGGYFDEKCKPYNFNSHYTVIKCTDNIKIQSYNEHDLFIIGLIGAESNMQFTIV